jgi:TRAP transporter TAXI family solute receptor
MRKNIIAILAILTLAIGLLTGFLMTKFSKPADISIRIATGGDAGVYYAYGNALAKLLDKHSNIKVTVIPSGGSMENIKMLRNGRVDMAFVQNDIMNYAYNGTNLYSVEGPFKEFYAMASLYPETCQIVARNSISRITDLKGKRVSIGAEGSGTELNALQILETYGIGYTDIYVDHLGFSASVSAFKEGKIDAFFCTAGIPTPAIRQLTENNEAHLLSISAARTRLLISYYPYYSKQIIPSDTYPGIEERAETVAVKAALVASDKLGEKIVSEVLKIMFENASEIAEEVPGIIIDRKSAMEGLSIPLHTGAEKFFLQK